MEADPVPDVALADAAPATKCVTLFVGNVDEWVGGVLAQWIQKKAPVFIIKEDTPPPEKNDKSTVRVHCPCAALPVCCPCCRRGAPLRTKQKQA